MKSLTLFGLMIALCSSVLAPARPIVLDDPAGDDHGPGTYVCPAVEGMRPGWADLRRLAVDKDDGRVTVKATFARAIETIEARLGRDRPASRIFLPVVDIYVQVPGGGMHRVLLPGRRVQPQSGWDRAVVLSAVPEVLEAHYSRVSSAMVKDICFARNVRAIGASLIADLPARCLPDALDEAAFLVLVTGLGSGTGLGDLVLGSSARTPDTTDPLVREVAEQPGLCGGWEGTGTSPCWCGGCRPCGWHPFVLDAVVPNGASQEALLSDYSASEKRLASLPFVNRFGMAVTQVGPVHRVTGPRHPVLSARGRQVSIRLGSESYPPGTIGAIICPGEQPGGTVVATGEAGGYLVLEKTDDTAVCPGAEIEF